MTLQEILTSIDAGVGAICLAAVASLDRKVRALSRRLFGVEKKQRATTANGHTPAHGIKAQP